jgi:aryl-alcohol dehydrogenase-like predicted oxidoreductase
MGRLTGKYSKANPPPNGRNFSNISLDELEPLLESMRRIAEKRNVSVSSIALNYVVCKGIVYSLIFYIHRKEIITAVLIVRFPLLDGTNLLFFGNR